MDVRPPLIADEQPILPPKESGQASVRSTTHLWPPAYCRGKSSPSAEGPIFRTSNLPVILRRKDSRSKAFDLDSVVCQAWVAATKVELVPIAHHLPVLPPKDQLPHPFKEKLLPTKHQAQDKCNSIC